MERGRTRRKAFLRYCLLPQTIRRAAGVAIIVAPLLVVINHAEAILELDLTPRLLVKIALTFLVPYAVSSCSSALALLDAADRNARPPVSRDV
jgi:hypothetical protein